MLIYTSLFESRLRYGSLGWGTAPEYYISKLRVLQNRAVRFISFASFRSNVLPIYSLLEVLPLNDILTLQKSVFMHSLHTGNLPFMLSSYCLPVEHTFSTRYASNLNYRLPIVHSKCGQSSIKFSGPKAWTLISKEVKEIAFRKPFSRRMKNTLLKTLKDKCKNLSITYWKPQDIENSNSDNQNVSDDSHIDCTLYDLDNSDMVEQNENDRENSIHSAEYDLSLLDIFQCSDSESEFMGF